MTIGANPYIAGSPVTGPEMFFGREDVFDFVRRTLTGQHRDQVIVLYGQRRTGKTSVLYQLRHHLDPRYLCIFVDLHGLALEGLGGFLWELTNHIRRRLRRDYQIDLPPLERLEFMADPRGQFEDQFLNQVWAASGDRHALLMLDEAVRLQEQVQVGKLEREVFDYLRHLMQHFERLNFLFSLGSGLEEMEKEYALLFNVALYKKISFLDWDAAVALVTEPVKEAYEVDQQAIEHILGITSCHPYYTQLICHSLFNRWQQGQISRITVADVDATLDEVVERGLAVLKFVWEESTPAEKALLAGMTAAMGPRNRPVSVQQIGRAWAGLGVVLPAGEVARATQSLISREVIVGEEEFRFTVDLQHVWTSKYERLAWVKEEIGQTIGEWTYIAPVPEPVTPPAPGPRVPGRDSVRSWPVRLLIVVIGLSLAVAAVAIAGSGLTARLFSKATATAQPAQIPADTALPAAATAVSEVPRGEAAKVNDLAVGAGFVWAATEGGLVRWSPDGRADVIPGTDLGLPDNCVNFIAAAPDGSFWAGCGGVAHFGLEGDQVQSLGYFDQDDGLGLIAVRAFIVDHDGSLWAGGLAGRAPLSSFDGEQWRTNELPLDDPALEGVDMTVQSILRSTDGALWVGLRSDGVMRWDGTSWTHFDETHGVGGSGQDTFRIRRLLQDGDGTIWAAASLRGLRRFDVEGGQWRRVIVMGEDEFITEITQFADGSLWAAGYDANQNGFVARSLDGGDSWAAAAPWESAAFDITGLVQDATGQVWAGTYDGGISVYDGEGWRHLQR